MHSNFLFSGHDEFSDITNSLSIAVVYFVQMYRIMSSTNNDNFTISFWILTLTLLHWIWPSVQCWIDLMMVAIQASVTRKVFLSISPLTWHSLIMFIWFIQSLHTYSLVSSVLMVLGIWMIIICFVLFNSSMLKVISLKLIIWQIN